MEGTVFAVMAPADEEEISSMYRRAAEKGRLDGSSHWNADYPDRETLREDLARGGVYGLKRRGRLLAVISAEGEDREITGCGAAWFPGQPWVLARLCVEPKSQGQGLARLLMERMIAEAKKEGLDTLQILAVPANAAANHLYASLGCRSLGPVRLWDTDFLAYEYPLGGNGSLLQMPENNAKMKTN